MAGESQETPGSRPDPSVLTTEQLEKGLRAERDYVDGQIGILVERLNGMDKASVVLHETVTRTPTDIQKAVAHLEALSDEKFSSIQTQFRERDTRSERESRDNKVAVDAAFAAQKEAAAKQDEANAKAIEKSEKATAETIKTNQELSRSTTDSLTKQLDEAKQAITRIDASKAGATENRTGLYATIGIVSTVFFLVVGILGFLATRPT